MNVHFRGTYTATKVMDAPPREGDHVHFGGNTTPHLALCVMWDLAGEEPEATVILDPPRTSSRHHSAEHGDLT